MKKSTLVLAGALLIANGFAFAGPDWQIIQKARQVKQSEQDKRTVFPLDHGPHAQATPWANKQKQQAEGNSSLQVAVQKKQGN